MALVAVLALVGCAAAEPPQIVEVTKVVEKIAV
jgi:hypothetical protein